jgi:hypothetical protein
MTTEPRCPSCDGPLARTGTGVPNRHNRQQRLTAVGMTCTRCGLNVNSVDAAYAAQPWRADRRRPDRDGHDDSIVSQTRTKEGF